MPAQYDTQLDNEPTPDACETFVGGMYSNAKARLLKPEQASLIADCDISVTGSVASRRGTVQIGADVASSPSITGVGYYKAGASNYELAATNTGVYKLSGGVWVLLGTQTFGSGQVNLIQGGLGGGSVFGTVGDDKLHACGDATDIFQWSGTAPWVNLSSPETTNSAPRNASLLCWHTGRLVAAGASIKTRTGDTSVVPDGIYFSDILDPANWGAALGGGTYSTQIRVGGGDGSEITAIVPWTDINLAVFKRNSCWAVIADPTLPPSDFTIQAVHSSVGCIAKRSAVQVGADVMFLSQDGVRSLQQTFASNSQENLSVPLSYPIQDYIRRINWNSAGNSCATFWNNKYILWAPLDISTTNNFAFVYDTIISAWSGYWTNLPVSCCTIRKSSATQSLMMGLHTDNKVIEYLDYVNEADAIDTTYQDWNAFNVVPALVTRAMTFGDPKAPKHGLDYEIEWSDSKGVVATILLYDGLAPTQGVDLITMTDGGFSIPFSLPLAIGGAGIQRQMFDLYRHGRFRELQFAIDMTGPGRKELRQVTVNAQVEPAANLLSDGVGQQEVMPAVPIVVIGYTLTGPSSGVISAPSTSFTVSLPGGAVVSGTVTITPSDGVGGGTFTPTTVGLTTGSPSATFTYTPASYGVKTISVTNNGGLTDPVGLSYTSVASTYLFSGPSTGVVSVPSTNFTVQLPAGGFVIGTVVVTPADGGGGGAFTPTTVNLTTGSPSATFTYTPGSTGAKTISVTNGSGLTNPGNLTYTSTVALHLLNTLVSYWTLDEATGTTRNDSVGTNNLADSGGTAGLAAIINNGAYFAGSNDLEHGNNSTLQVTGDFTLSVWVRTDNQFDNYAIAKADATTIDYMIMYRGSSGTADGFRFTVNGTSVSKGSIEATFGWHHVVAWYDSSDGKLRFRLDDTTTFTSGSAATLVQNASNIALGARSGVGFTTTIFLDEVGFWKRKLTSTEITALYNAGAGLPFSSFTI